MRRTARLPLRAASPPVPTFRSRPLFLSAPCRRTLVSAADLQFGQPLHETHPHLIKPGELTPGISALEYHHRRAALARKLPRNSIAILAANDLQYRSGAVFYEFHQEPNFFYLTGFNEPEAVAVIEKGESDVEYTFHLFVRPKDARAERWDGARSGVQAARDVFNADEAGDVADLSSAVPDLMRAAKEVYTDVGSRGGRPTAVTRFFAGAGARAEEEEKDEGKKEGGGGGGGWWRWRRRHPGAVVRALQPVMNELRVTKSAAELECLRRAGAGSGAVVTDAMSVAHDSERRLWAHLAHGFRSHGGLEGEAYVPVVAGGTNALSIHYVRNDALLRPGDFALVDAGGQYGGYVADITRTWPVDGRFTDPQRQLYAVVLAAQKACVALCREDADVTLDRLHATAERLLTEGLRDLGFDVAVDHRRRAAASIDALFPHHVGHHVGLDVHDAPGHPRTDPLREDQCITIEPGVYVAPDDERWPARFRGLGVRIEDSVRVGKDRPEVLTATAVKEVEDIEALRS